MSLLLISVNLLIYNIDYLYNKQFDQALVKRVLLRKNKKGHWPQVSANKLLAN